MFRPRVIPCLLLKNKGLVKTINFKQPRYIGDPINAVKLFNDFEADELIFLDISATNENREPNIQIIKNIAEESYMPFSYGGGIININQIRNILSSGAEKVCLNSILYTNPEIVNKAALMFGNQSIVATVDVKTNIFGRKNLYSNSAKRKHKINILSFVKEMEERGAGEIMINSIDHDGKMDGYDLDLVEEISSIINIPLIICGGAGNFQHIQNAVKKGASACAAGSLFVYHGNHKAVLINYPTLKELKELFK